MCMQLTIRVISILECVNNNEDTKLQDLINLYTQQVLAQACI